MAKTDIQFNLRIPEELKFKIEASAKSNNRSINAEALVRLEKSFTEQQSVNLTRLEEEISRLSTEAREMRMLYIEAITAKGLNK